MAAASLCPPPRILEYSGYTVRQWYPSDREPAAAVVKQCLEAYGLRFEPEGADQDAIDIEHHYQRGERGEFWVVADGSGQLVGTAAYYELPGCSCDDNNDGFGGKSIVEIRKMYLLPEARGKKLGRVLLEALERRIAERGYGRVVIETASVLKEACQLYRSSGYLPLEGVETARCDMRMYKDIGSSGNNKAHHNKATTEK